MLKEENQNTDFSFDFNFDMDSFANTEIDITTEFETRYIKPPKTKDIKDEFLMYDNAVKLAKEIKQLKNFRYYCIVNGSFIFGDFIEAFIVENNLKCKELTIQTLSLSLDNIYSLKNLIVGGFVDKLNLIVSDYWFSHERNDLVESAYKHLDIDNKFQLAVAGTHLKTCIFETEQGHKVVIYGSANLRSSNNIEQFTIEENEELYDFNKEMNEKILDKYKTIEKSIIRGKLWQLINQVQADIKK